MDKLITRLNIDHYRKVLAAETDPERRQEILRLLAKEDAKLAALEGPSSPAAAADSAATAAPPVTAHEGVSHLNLEYYRKRLETETDLVIRQILMRLIAEEEERLAAPEARKVSGGDQASSANE